MQHEKTPKSGPLTRKRQMTGGIEKRDTTAPIAEKPAALSDLPIPQDPSTASASPPRRRRQDDTAVIGMENRLMAEMRNTMQGIMDMISEKMEKQMTSMAAASDKKMTGMQKIIKKQDENMKKQIAGMAASEQKIQTAVKNLEMNMSTKMDSLQEEVNTIREASEASNSLIVGSVGRVSRHESIEDHQQDDPEEENSPSRRSPRNELSPGDIETGDTTAPIVEKPAASASSPQRPRQDDTLPLKKRHVEPLSREEMIEAINKSNENQLKAIKEVIGSIGDRSGSQVANPQQAGPSEPNRMLKGLLEHQKERTSSNDASGIEDIQQKLEEFHRLPVEVQLFFKITKK